ncbi:MAG: plastocyanin/azurin family copper-binding protein [Ginsengibacter sp.]
MKLFKILDLRALVIIAGMVVITSCSSNQNKKYGENENPRSDTVLINLMQFSPSSLNLQAGDTITWINKDLVDHTVKDTLGDLFYSDTLKTGHSFSWIVTGKAEYICTLHPTMQGRISINE